MTPSRMQSLPVSFGIQNLGEYSYSTRRLSLAFTASTILYGFSGIALLAMSIVFRGITNEIITGSSSSYTASTSLALKPVDLRLGIVAGSITLAVALLCVPGTIINSRPLLKSSLIAKVASILITLTFGLSVWFVTLIERQEFLVFWQRQSSQSTVLIQDRFDCCGYFNSTTPQFTISTACPNADMAATKRGCFLPFVSFADRLL